MWDSLIVWIQSMYRIDVLTGSHRLVSYKLPPEDSRRTLWTDTTRILQHTQVRFLTLRQMSPSPVSVNAYLVNQITLTSWWINKRKNKSKPSNVIFHMTQTHISDAANNQCYHHMNLWLEANVSLFWKKIFLFSVKCVEKMWMWLPLLMCDKYHAEFPH